MRRFALLAAGVVVLTAGCATPPQDPKGVRAAQQPPHIACSQLSVDEAASRIRRGWERCFGARRSNHAGMPVGAMSNVRPWLRVERSGEITSVLVMFSNSSSWNHSAVFLADIQATPACAAQVTSRGWDAGWNSYATSSATWLENPDAMPEHCPR